MHSHTLHCTARCQSAPHPPDILCLAHPAPVSRCSWHTDTPCASPDTYGAKRTAPFRRNPAVQILPPQDPLSKGASFDPPDCTLPHPTKRVPNPRIAPSAGCRTQSSCPGISAAKCLPLQYSSPSYRSGVFLPKIQYSFVPHFTLCCVIVLTGIMDETASI